MMLVIGSEASGKRSYVKSLGYADSDISENIADGKPVLIGLHNIVARNPEGSAALVGQLLNKHIVVCNEVGSGIIPNDARERLAREQTGRLCIQLAQRADKVVRLVCGVAVVIKG